MITIGRSTFARVGFSGLLAAALSCASSKPQPISERSSGSDAPPATVAADELIGAWVEFWAVSGRADTQRYDFGADGSFEWHAAPGSTGPGPVLRAGRFKLEAGALILSVTREEPAGPQARSVEQRMPLGACPPDQEARALDESYRCLSFNGRAFWRRPR